MVFSKNCIFIAYIFIQKIKHPKISTYMQKKNSLHISMLHIKYRLCAAGIDNNQII